MPCGTLCSHARPSRSWTGCMRSLGGCRSIRSCAGRWCGFCGSAAVVEAATTTDTTLKRSSCKRSFVGGWPPLAEVERRGRDCCPYRRLGLDLPSYDFMALIRAELSEALPLEGPSSDHQLPPG